jgi:redox-sensitive bicupin YhaK (pirin superfamily)
MAEAGGKLEFIQFWVNSPAAHKMDPAYYLPLSDADTPRLTNDGTYVAVVAGEYEGTTGPAPTLSPMTLLRGEVKKGKSLKIKLPASFNTLVYLLDGAVSVNGESAKAKDLIYFGNDGEEIKIEAIETTRFIVLGGEPIDEEVTSYGPFVMNTQTEIMEALRDAQAGKMGVLIEEF